MYTLKLSQQEVQLVISALGELPLKIAAATYGSIERQVIEQDAANAIELPKG